MREDCLDWRLILDERHLRQVLKEVVEHYHRGRPHRALTLSAPLSRGQPIAAPGEVVRHNRLGGHLHKDERAAA